MRVKLIISIVLVAILGFGSFGFAQLLDSDGDLNADSADPFPGDPLQGGVFAGAIITYNVLMAGDLNVPVGFTGIVITIAADGVTFDGNGHQIITSVVGTVMQINNRMNVTIVNVIVPGMGFGTGLTIGGTFGNTVTGCDFSNHSIGIQIDGNPGGAVGNILDGNNCSNGAIGINVSSSSGNQILNNNCSGNSEFGINLSNSPPMLVSANDFSNSNRGIRINGFDSSVWPQSVADMVSQNTFTGVTRAGIHFLNTVTGSQITDVDFRTKGIVGFQLEIGPNGDNLTVARINASGLNNGLKLNSITNSTISEITAPGMGSGVGLELLSSSGNTMTGSDFSSHSFLSI